MVVPNRPSSESGGKGERFRLPKVPMSFPQQRPIRRTELNPITRLPPISRTRENSSFHMGTSSRPPIESSNFTIPRFNRRNTATGTFPCQRMSQINLPGRNENYLLNFRPAVTGVGIFQPESSVNIDVATASYNELKQSNFAKSPYRLSKKNNNVMDPRKLKALKTPTSHSNDSPSSSNNINEVTTPRRSSIRSILSIPNKIISQTFNTDYVNDPSSTSPPIPSLKSKHVKHIKKFKKKEENVLSAYTIMDPGSQEELDILRMAKLDAQLNPKVDENNNFGFFKSPSRKAQTAKTKRRKPNTTARTSPSDITSMTSAMSQAKFRPPTGQRGKTTRNNQDRDPEVKNMSRKIFRKLQELGLEDAFSGSNSIKDRKATLDKLKRAYAVLQKQLEDLNVDEAKISAKGLDYKSFEKGQKRELESVRFMAQPFMSDFKGMKPIDFRRRDIQIPLNHLHDMLQAPVIDKSLLLNKVHRAPAKANINTLQPSVKKIGPKPSVPFATSPLTVRPISRQPPAKPSPSETQISQRPVSTTQGPVTNSHENPARLPTPHTIQGSSSRPLVPVMQDLLRRGFDGRKQLIVQGLVNSEGFRKTLQARGPFTLNKDFKDKPVKAPTNTKQKHSN